LLEETTAAIRSINTLAPIRRCSLAKRPDEVPIEELLAIDAFDVTKLLEDGRDFDEILNPDGKTHGHSHGHSEDCSDAACTDSAHGHGHESSHSTHGHESSHSAHGHESSHSAHGHESSHSAHGHESSHSADCTDSECTDSSHGHGHSHSHGASRHDTDIGTMMLEMDGSALDVDKFHEFVTELLLFQHADLYRYKGVLAVEQKGYTVRYVLQGVHDMMEVSFSGPWPRDRPVKTQVVLIGRKLDREKIEDKFSKCVSLEAVPCS
jgi:G3E family GTPase